MAAAESAIDNDLFQPQRARPQAEDAISMPAIAVAPRAPAPRLTLRGVIGGPPWDVIIDGIPGRPAGTVMRDGDYNRVPHFEVQSILRRHGSLEAVRTRALEYTDIAAERLATLPDSPHKRALISILDLVVERDS